MTERVKKILEAYDTFSKTPRKRLVAGTVFDYFMQEFRIELGKMYDNVSREGIKEDIKEMADIIYSEENKSKREFLVEVLVDIVKIM